MSNERFLRRREVERMVSLSRSTIYAHIAKGTFPIPRRIGKNAVAFLSSEIIEWMDGRPLATSNSEVE